MTMTIVIAMMVVAAILIVMIMKIEGSRNVVQKYNISYFMKHNHCRQGFQKRISCAGRLLLPKPESTRKASSTSRPTGSRPTSPTTRPGTTDPSSCLSSTPPAAPPTPRLHSPSQRRHTIKSWILSKMQPSQTQRTPLLGCTMHGWLAGAELLQSLCGSPQVIGICIY